MMLGPSVSDAKPALMVLAPLSITSVCDGGPGPVDRDFFAPAMPTRACRR